VRGDGGRTARLAAVVAALALVGAVGACSSGGGGDGGGAAPEGTTTTSEPPTPTAAELCAGVQLQSPPVTVAQPALTETSGVATSRAHDGIVWAHNDSGGAPEVFAIGPDGADRGRWALAGAQAVDWEDMARGPAPGGGGDDLYLADIGDNRFRRTTITVYRAPEPAVGEGATGGTIDGVAALTLAYPDGAHDAEALLADPVSGDLFVVTKAWGGVATGVYRVPAGTEPAAGGVPLVMTREGDAAVPAGQLVTGGDVTVDGAVVGLRTYGGVLLWDRTDGQTVPEALAATPCAAPAAAEPQGEALAFDPDGRGYVTVSEGATPPVDRARLP